MSASTLQPALLRFQMSEESGLVPTTGTASDTSYTHPRARRILRDARELGASHVLFRLPEAVEKPPIPQVYIFDDSDTPRPPAEIAELQRKVWNSGVVPLLFIFQNDRVDIFNALEKPKLYEGIPQPLTPVQTLILAGKISKKIEKDNAETTRRFSADQFANGTFWDDADNSTLLTLDTAQKTLLQEMRNAHKAIAARGILSTELTRRFFILCLMVKYLEDRKILHADYFKGFHVNAENFEYLLRSGDNEHAALRVCLKNLSNRFNGDVFSLTAEEEKAISTADLTPYAEFVEGQLAGAQLYLWKLYSFEYLPVELISYIYEDFLQHNKEAVYTPHMLVDLLLDEIMPARGIPDDYRILDPACGSGVFLVGAFRRLVEAHYADNPNVALGEVHPDRLCAMLVNNIFGVDTDPIAVELTSFSLCVAMCSELSPKSARAGMKFPSLAGKIASGTANENRSIRERDFFALTENAGDQPGSFDLIIGNPPFGSNEQENLAAKVALDTKGPRVPFPRLPDKQLCYLFLRDAPKLLKEGGVGCLLQKDGFLYNGGVLEFRAAFLQNYDVPQIFDFVSIRQMFTGLKSPKKSSSDGEDDDGEHNEVEGTDTETKPAEKKVGYVDVKVVAVFFRRPLAEEPLSQKPILHATFRKLFTAGRRRSFELDAYDYHWVSRKTAIEEPRVWKANLLGGGRLLATYRAILAASGRTIGSFLESQPSEWGFSEGYSIGDKGAKPEPKLTGMNCIDRGRNERGPMDWSRTKPLEARRFKSTGDLRIYTPPHLIVWEHESVASCYREEGEDLSFSKRFVGFSCPPKSKKDIERLAQYLDANRSDLQFFLAFSAYYLTNKQSAILKEDIMDLPFPENGKLEFRGVEECLVRDVIERQIRFIKVGANAESTLFKPTTAAQLTEYTDAFLQVIQTVYPETKCAEQIEFANAHCIAFSFGDKPNKPFGNADELEAHLDALLLKQKGHALRIRRIVRLFDNDRLYYVKPKAYRFWTRSIAVRDADEAFASLVAQGF